MWCAAILAAGPWLAACGAPAPQYLTLATTTSVGNSGLLDVLLPAFQKQHDVTVRPHLVGSGRALVMLGNGTADVVISHAPDAEAAALAAHPGWTYRKFMYNDFVIVGPTADPADVSSARSVEDAARRMAAGTARFLSRGDQSGTHEREQQLWRLAGVSPGPDRLVIAGAGMGTTLRVASETGAYTLTDRATFAQLAGALRLRIVFEGGPHLTNTYAIIVGNGERRAAATAFGIWLTEGPGRDLIARYRAQGTEVPAFHVWPRNRPYSSTTDVPE
jgi:tungstate transport system substrate-binding protein